MESKFHTFAQPIQSIPLPERFTYPFHYTPHPLCVIAAEETQAYLKERTEWREELQAGKMFGVLVVRTPAGEVGYLAAFSGNLAGKNVHPFFVPPIYDLLQPDGFFRQEEERINEINARIRTLQASPALEDARLRLQSTIEYCDFVLQAAKDLMKKRKEERDRLRQFPLTEEETALLIKESQHMKAAHKLTKKSLRSILEEDQAKVDRLEQEIEQLKQERKRRSAALQRKLFEQFRILNARGEVKDLCELFAPTYQGAPPAGAGECAAPKLLQYAYQHQLEPIAMAEFWWGDSPKTEIRHHGYYYPACKGKCEPILHHMLQGLRVDENPLLADSHRETKLDILYEDDYLLVINKPEGMLSVPGKGDVDSVYQRLSILYPEATGPIIVHRLDMATSGLLLAAKTKEAHQNLQAQFKNRTIQKRYIALLEGEVPQDEGEIRLPLCPDPLDRPRQIVSEKFGKPAFTRYRVLERTSGKTLIAFYPQTGRTHQLRVHAAHPLGLHCPILGDELYGRKAERLYLHAEYLAFTHPITSERIEIQKSPAFPRRSMP
ncbi:RluA family pseudouridine synthase [Parabacteroides distasonis]|uniref:RluA family pseudouridine synthase n=1 Tax=Parabacteroides distasonis TaxID=823 RepID=UPI0018AA557F|nr:RluA family pseudouridine synthase [Parabacteroides distasonis]MDB9025498.1 RluA family pseudouridine synthase [Parabacteroides distasonis]MDB9041897.1 RluA family pseudouridine synthase [Parabacteroides distasonis]MDB9094280.1 RluA family pseudouridine synthase [Parabacteroides distasonis]MDB9159422.1 RluA family pseudouridine synthase [Parabacteroides distasonis]